MLQALGLLPGDTDVKQVKEYLENVIERLDETRRKTDVLRSLMYTEKYLVRQDFTEFTPHCWPF